MTVALKYCPHGCGYRTLSLRSLAEHEETHQLVEPVEPEPDTTTEPTDAQLMGTAADLLDRCFPASFMAYLDLDEDTTARVRALIDLLRSRAALAETR
jgi:hypothetical protein